ncbi:DUF3488 and transglutaminase-like domain-containing protein [Synechococcus sp. CS-1325]|uniref:transglutaminase family protein n=1 Tax=unclassified Synechococcus TaxID=2626047 RepID=UPI0021A5504D|nr:MULTISPECIES: transglutaminase domain-containing protein [unclassified Synechococcus]MCT0200136.1 DUF3488 and transglutaminase-like domain-containing protein [Synechococcus sp. CS-1325]MCT0212677.1 DUF3488 and transglutaminase-like domain-containing protein [Synechococcus sp. CS-1326]MCT0233685.1 DUF3488 and transglutaminase-like domain-containing protein [Synechococcus sp. CS-1327]
MRRVRRLHWLGLGLLGLQLPGLDTALPLSWGAIALVVLGALKLREARRAAELRRMSLLLLVATGVMAALLPGLGPSLLQVLTTLVALAALLAQELGDGLLPRQLLGRSFRLLAAALPLVLVLFLLLPRLGPVFSVPLNQAARTGLSDRIEPGSIASLVAIDAPAVRIGFEAGQPPAEPERYWRVLVLNRFDGRRWERDAPDPPFRGTRPPLAASRDELWLAEPSRLPLLPWSGRGQPLQSELSVGSAGELINDRPPGERRGYALGATDRTSDWQTAPLSAGAVAAATAFPTGANPRLEGLGAGWASGQSPERRLETARQWFLSQAFRYTLQPGSLSSQAPLDAFLFDTQEGFCEHYAAAFTALMRAAGVPARVVAGYQGGRWVPQLGGGGYLDVRQSDAHAWSEVWLAGVGWQRVDPTGWVAPARINPGLPGSTERRAAETGPLVWLQQQWRGLDLRWTGWVLGFNRQAQAALLERLLGARRDWLGLLLLAAVAFCLAVTLPLLRWGQNRGGVDPLRRELERGLVRLRRLGFEPTAGEDLGGFCARVAADRPELRTPLRRFANLYLAQRFGPPGSAAEQRAARRLLGRLLPRGLAARPDQPETG